MPVTARHNRQDSFRTKDRYYQAMKRFCAYLADEYRLQKLTNISGKHLTSYVLWMQENGKTAGTIDEHIIIAMREQLKRTKRGRKLLVLDDMHTDRAINQLQFFIYSNREDFQEDANRPLTFHGLRHTYAAEKYMELIQNGTNALDAHFEVSRLLGHERADVTNIYLASLPAKGMKDKH